MRTDGYKHIVVVHGEKPHKTGEPHREFLMRLERARAIAERGGIDAIVVTGGSTRKGCRDEADFGREYLRGRTGVPVFVERKSKTTAENIVFARDFFAGSRPERVTAVTSAAKSRRLKFLYWRLWPETRRRVDVAPVPDAYGFHVPLAEAAYLAYAFFDPRGSFLTALAKKLFRNG